MESGKRASMREGPLRGPLPQDRGGGPGRQGRRQGQARGGQGGARRVRPDGRSLAPAGRIPSRGHSRTSACARTSDPRSRSCAPRRRRHVPCPASSSRASPRSATCASPEERLRHVFSTDIPENIMELSSHVRAAPSNARASGARSRACPDVRPRPVLQPVLRVVGVGGAGVNAVNRMIEAGVEGVDFIAHQHRPPVAPAVERRRDAPHRHEPPRAGSAPGRTPSSAARRRIEDYDLIKRPAQGLGHGVHRRRLGRRHRHRRRSGGRAIARELGALAVGIVTKPFSFEGSRRGDQADRASRSSRGEVDTLIVIPNSRLLIVLDKRTSMVDAFRMADDVLRQGVQGISDLITLPGLINLDFADVRTIMSDAGTALLGIGMGVGEHRAMDAATRAVASPLLETSVEGARSILLSITGGRDMSLWEVNEAAKAVAEAAHPGREHHLRRHGRREGRGPGVGHRRRHRLRRRDRRAAPPGACRDRGPGSRPRAARAALGREPGRSRRPGIRTARQVARAA